MGRVVIAGVALLGLVGAAAPGTSQERARDSLRVTPAVYVAGQKMTFTGSIGGRSRKTIRLQFHMNRPGDRWTKVDGFSTRTDSAGRFKFTYPAPAMWGISFRVVSKGADTPRHTFHARSQEVMLSVKASAPDVPEGSAVAGESFVVTADTAPSVVGREELPPPVIPGRTVTLQKRVSGDRWQTVATDQTDQNGFARFDQTVTDPGQVVYRAREENWTRNGDRIGWFPSFPTYVDVLTRPLPAADRTPLRVRAEDRTPIRAAGGGSPNASQRYGWGRSLWDFAWEYGESLTSRPFRGTDRKGRWIDASDGSGRASHVNGGMGLDSQFGSKGGPGDHGTTSVTLKGNPQKYGRWELRLRSLSREASAQDYRVKIELIPDRAGDYHCGAQNITVADYAVHAPQVRVGVNARRKNRSWTYTKSSVRLDNESHNYAVEVAKDYITWFLDGKAIATVKSRAAVSDVPLTLRLSLQGKGQTEMNRTRAIFDWMRAWPIDTGRRSTNGHRLTGGKHNASC